MRIDLSLRQCPTSELRKKSDRLQARIDNSPESDLYKDDAEKFSVKKSSRYLILDLGLILFKIEEFSSRNLGLKNGLLELIFIAQTKTLASRKSTNVVQLNF